MPPKPQTDAFRDWSAWVERAIRRGPAEAGRAMRFLDGCRADHPNLKGVSADQRASLRARLDAARLKGV